jgi:hypothetical protein
MKNALYTFVMLLFGATHASADGRVFYKQYMGCDFYFQNSEVSGSYLNTVELDEHLTGINSDDYRLRPVCNVAPNSVIVVERHPEIPNTDYYRGIYSLDTVEGNIASLTEYYVSNGCPIELELWIEGSYSYSNTHYQRSCLQRSASPEAVSACKLAVNAAGESSGYASAICDRTRNSSAHWACVQEQASAGYNIPNGQGFCRRIP